ncbi:MAG: hypothetical protein CVU39_23370 [Chloroflexi bacterium HGW-Chloroflexi-10]|nr:MAG: hypothetical protein CVU39_23370 [Chloroflexi bacterium HGW-Chloroflexi-10]
MNLRRTTILVVFATFLLLALVLSLSLQGLLRDHFQYEENQQNLLNIERVRIAFENNYLVLNYLVNDWSNWNDTYQFVQNADPIYIQNNLVQSTFTDLDVNVILILDRDGSTLYAGAYDFQEDAFVRIPPSLYAYLHNDDSSLNFRETHKNLIMVDGKPLLLVSSPILTSDGEGPARGALFMGRYFGQKELQLLAEQVQLPVEAANFSEVKLGSDFEQAKRFFEANEESVFSLPLTETSLAGYLLLRDVTQTPALILRIEQARTLARNATLVMRYLVISQVITSLLFAIIFFVLIERTVLSRVLRLSREVQDIAAHPQNTIRVTENNQDELGTLSNHINLMLIALENTREELNNRYEEVQTSRERLQELSHKLLQVHEEERRWLARELHDEIGQYLTALKLRLDQNNLVVTDGVPQLQQAQTLVNELIHKVRQISLDLRPSILDDLGLLPALEWYLDRYRQQTAIQVQFTHQGLARQRFSPETELTVFRVIQESLTNVARHAKTDFAMVTVEARGQVLEFSIEDCGLGFDVSEKTFNSNGLVGMTERVVLLQGKLIIDSKPGKGTRIAVKLPLDLEK